MTASSTTDAIVVGMKAVTLDHPHADYYYPDDTASDSTITATAKDLSRHATEKRQDWRDEIEHSFDSSCNDNNYTLDDFNAYETTIMQSFLEPSCPEYMDPPPLPKQKSRFSVIKSKVKQAFCIASPTSHYHYPQQQQQQGLMQSSLPVFPTATTCNSSVDTRWNPSIDSSICSSSTLRPPDQTSTHSNKSNASSSKPYSYGFQYSNSSSSSPPFATTQKPPQRHSTVSRIKNRFSRTPSLGTLPISVPTTPIKGILKKQTNAATTTKPTKTMRPSLTRPASALLPTDPRQQHQLRKKRWSIARFSVYSSNPQTKKRYSVFSVMNNDKRRSQPLQQTLLSVENGRVRFNMYLDVQETYAKGDYDRSSDPDAVCNRLTAATATQIKRELNYFKLHEMQVHDYSREYTHFFT
ncbi:uncharacterized protein ATC70_004502 [Mucor velutinosus]|uniref:Uncharacterized protein n=1 Tax=Mucor velutinosus TaxID=708070 RepID=A0AAN7I4N1_9FUNG|nr:hypothetical protein ATC70_004502 [Mucor velutinosus]